MTLDGSAVSYFSGQRDVGLQCGTRRVLVRFHVDTGATIWRYETREGSTVTVSERTEPDGGVGFWDLRLDLEWLTGDGT